MNYADTILKTVYGIEVERYSNQEIDDILNILTHIRAERFLEDKYKVKS